jgi:hypothetical protein
MIGQSAPIDLAPERGSGARQVLRGVRAVGRLLHAAAATAVVLGVFLQVYLIGSFLFGAGQPALDAHRTVGWWVHGFELLVLVGALVALLPRADILLSLLLAVIGTVQVSLAGEHRWVGGLHALFALVVLGTAVTLARRSFRRWRDARRP